MTIFDLKFDDANYDMQLDNADISMAEEDDILKERLKSRYQFILGEWFLDTSVGLPYPTVIFEKGVDLRNIYAIFRAVTLNTLGVEEIKKLELTPDAEGSALGIVVEVNQGTLVELEVGI